MYLDSVGVSFLWARVKQLVDGCAQASQLADVMRLKGAVTWDTSLPESAQKGDVYNVTSTGMNYVWDGEQWDPLGEPITREPISEEMIDEMFTLI